MQIRRGEVNIARFFEFPHEDQKAVEKERPVLILQDDEDNINQLYPLVIVAPISTKKLDRIYKQDILIPAEEAELNEGPKMLLGIIRTIQKVDLVKKIGNLSKSRMEEVNIKLFRVLGFLER